MFRRRPAGRHRLKHPDHVDAVPRLFEMMDPTVVIPRQRQPFNPQLTRLDDSMALEDDRGWAP